MSFSFFDAPDGRQLAYSDTGGAGDPVLCLAGLTRNMADYADLAVRLAPRYRVVCADYRGRGASEWAEDAIAEYSPIVEGQDALALLDHLGLARAAIIGTSRGGIIGMLLAAGHPERVTALVLNDIGPVVEQSGLDFIMTYLGLDPGLADFDAAAAKARNTFGADYPDLSDADWLAFARRTYAERDGRPVLSYDPALRDATAAALEAAPADLWPVFDAITAPVLAIRGANSNLMTDGTLTEMAVRRPDMSAVTIANCGHPPFLDEPDAVAAIETFLEVHLT